MLQLHNFSLWNGLYLVYTNGNKSHFTTVQEYWLISDNIEISDSIKLYSIRFQTFYNFIYLVESDWVIRFIIIVNHVKQ